MPNRLRAGSVEPRPVGKGIKRAVVALPGGARLWSRLRRARHRVLRAPPLPPADPSLAAPRLGIVLDRPPPGTAETLRSLSPHLRLLAPGDPLDEVDYVYAPDRPEWVPGRDGLRNVLLCLAHRALDFLVLSHGLEEPPDLRITTPANAVVLARSAHACLRSTGRLPEGASGHVARLLPPPPGAALVAARPDQLGMGEIQARGADLQVGPTASARPGQAGRPAAPLFPAPDGTRPIVLVLPIMLAVGGVERNLIEVLKVLHPRYRFVVVTTERVNAERGSLNHQVAPCCEALFELGELVPQSEFLALLDSVARSFPPDLVFICNGSPWLLTHARALRERFADAPIVDQQAYDTKEGWIEFYADPGIQSFDRFVAINEPIRRAFVERIGIAPARVDLIYHAIDDARFSLARADACPRDAAARYLGLPPAARRFALVGRLAPQKRPLDFLELARRAQEAGLDDQFVLVGDGELAGACERYAAEHGLSNAVRVPFCDDMSRLYPLLDGLVVCSEYEGLPVVALEALAMGTPVLATDVGELRAVVEEYGAGRIVGPPGDRDLLLRAFLAWRADLDALRVLARRAAPRVATRFSAASVAAAYERSWQKAWESSATLRRR
jgi:glycosyltransferase involved in cell wall biosynthesis